MSELTCDPDLEKISHRYKLTPVELSELEADIRKRGCIHPLAVWQGILVDGYHRYRICERHGLPFETKEMAFADKTEATWWAWEVMKARRNLAPYARAEIELEQKALLAKQGKERQGEGGKKAGRGRPIGSVNVDGTYWRVRCMHCHGVMSDSHICEAGARANESRTKLAKAAKVSAGTLHKVEVIARVAPEDIKEKLRRGDTTINREYQAIKTADKRTDRASKCAEISKSNRELPANKRHYGVIYADPPWRYEHVQTESRAIENQYPTLSLEDICAIRVGDMALGDCTLFLWVTSPKVAEGLRVVEAWGFTYRTCAVWNKGKIGMGYYFRQQHELLFVATRGSPPAPPPSARVSSVLEYPRGKHSAKPEEIYGLIESMYPVEPRVELFARGTRDGWDAWGNQA